MAPQERVPGPCFFSFSETSRGCARIIFPSARLNSASSSPDPRNSGSHGRKVPNNRTANFDKFALVLKPRSGGGTNRRTGAGQLIHFQKQISFERIIRSPAGRTKLNG